MQTVTSIPITTAWNTSGQSVGTTKPVIDGIGGDVVNTIEGAKKVLDNLVRFDDWKFGLNTKFDNTAAKIQLLL